MPIYQYCCEKCGEVFEKITYRISAETKIVCPKCGAEDVGKVPSRGGFVINGYSEANGYGSQGDIMYDGSAPREF